MHLGPLLCPLVLVLLNILWLDTASAAQYSFPSSSWLQQNNADDTFTGRNGHAVAVFNDELWVIGGRSELYQAYNLEYTNRRGDVWSSSDYGKTWTQLTALTGDFAEQNFDALDPGPQAPWYARFGHTLNVLNATSYNGTTLELMVLTGGYTPTPNNDVWVTTDGKDWRFAGHAPWAARAWHEGIIFQDRLFIMGGTPMTNDVWAAVNITQTASGGWNTAWEQMADGEDVPWSPRAGLAGAVIEHGPGDSTLFVMGGFGGWPEGHKEYDAMRCRNDVYKTQDGLNWTIVTKSAAWEARAWHAVATWVNMSDPYSDVTPPATTRTLTGKGARMWLAGGGYMGQDANNIVSKMIGFVDMWWSSNGKAWHQVNYEEGSGSNLYSNMEWALTEVDDQPIYLGKWGHKMVSWVKEEEEDSGAISTGTIVPALYFIGGDAVGDGSLVSDVFVSNDTLLCVSEGIVCGGAGECSGYACSCPSTSNGDFCTGVSTEGGSGAWAVAAPSGWQPLVTMVNVVLLALVTVTAAAA